MDLPTLRKITLGFAALVAVGGIMGFLKRGSLTSLVAGGLSASVLYYVYTELPTRPAFASSLGLGVSATLVGAMGIRFLNTGKVFPAGVVALLSLGMSAAYLNSILRVQY